MKSVRLLTLFVVCHFIGGCLSASPFQSARATDPGGHQGHISVQRSIEEDEPADGAYTMVEFTNRSPLGSTGRADWAFSGAMVGYDEGGIGAMIGLAGKVEILSDHLALEVPVHFLVAAGGFEYTTHFYPRLIGTVNLAETVELNLSVTRYLYLAWDPGVIWGYSAGLGFGRRGGTIVRPEFAVLNYPYGDKYYQIGVGVEIGDRELPEGSTETTPR